MKRHNRLKKHTLGLAAALLVTAGMSQIALAGDSVYVNTSSLRYRTSAQIKDNNIAGNLSYGQKLERVGTSGQWTMILLNGKKYYVSSAYVTSKKPASAGAVQTTSQTAAGAQTSGGTAIALSSNYKYANYSKINSGTATLYRSTASNKKNKVVCVNAGHGTNGGGSVKTQCHPDGSAKVTGGTTGAGATSAVAVSSGMTFADGTAESKVTLAMAKVLKTKLLNAGYDVLMIRESEKKPVIIDVKDTSMSLAINSGIGSMSEDIDISKEGKDILIGFNPKFLMDALKVIDEEEITMYMINPKAPCFIRNMEETYVYLILPVNFN
mgnify:CR=1 FL=1